MNRYENALYWTALSILYVSQLIILVGLVWPLSYVLNWLADVNYRKGLTDNDRQ